MSTLDNSSAEQLWYTWSDVGLSTIHAGFRIRAASQGLSEIYSERVKSIDRYMRYVLPPGTDRFAITPDMAPVCLAFIRTDWNDEYILVHKNYVGEDGVGRLGNFFVHVIALEELSQYFSAEDAIWLWGSDIWETQDNPLALDRRSNKLETVPLKRLQSEISNFQPNFAQVRQYLPFLIEAYLSRKDRYPLYIAAPAHDSTMIAYLIAGLINCLPRQLMAGLTFSTYEPDVTKATMEIIGTSWIATPGKEVEASPIFSSQFYYEKLAVNCYTKEHSPLQGHPQIIYKPLAADFANYATECLLTDNVEQLYELIEQSEKRQQLDVDTFLRMYYNDIANTESIVEADIDRDLADPYLHLDRLCNRNFRKSIIERAGKNRQWSENQLQPRLRALREQSQREYVALLSKHSSVAISAEQKQISNSSLQGPRKRSKDKATTQTKKNQLTLAEALALLSERAISDSVDAMKKVGARGETVPNQSGEDAFDRQKKTETVVSLLSLMDCCLIPQNSLEVWRQLFDKIATNRNATSFLTANWEIFFWLLGKWDTIFPLQPEYDNAIHPVLIVSWNQLGEFLKLNLRQRHRQWNVIAVERLIKDPSPTPQIAYRLEQNYSREINDLLEQLLQETNFTTATSFVIRLIENSYPIKSQIAAPIEELLAQLIHNPQFWTDAKNLVIILTHSGYTGTASYQNLVESLLGSLLTQMQTNGHELFNVLVDCGYPRKKNLVDLLLRSSISQVNLVSILERVYRTPEELNGFFINDGSKYLSTHEQVRAMVSLYQKLLPLPQRLERLFVLLSTTPDGRTILDENTILELINITPLAGYESAEILKRYGKGYLQEFKQTPQLANKVVQWYIQLVKLGYHDRLKLLFTLFTSTTDYNLLETLLTSAQLSLGESQEFFRQYSSLPRYFPFFYQSSTTIALFSRLAQQANNLVASGHDELAMEKMHLLFAWLQPSQSQSPLTYQTVEKILQGASLTPNEQIAFLERYGEGYLSLYPRSPLLKEFVSTYINALTGDWLIRTETKSFFIFLTRKYQRLDLDTSVQDRIQWWMIIDSYFTFPDTRPEVLTNLTRALFTLALPNHSTFTLRLAAAFVFCVRKSDDLSNIMFYMQQVPKLQVVQMLYVIAEQVAAQYRQQQALVRLIPYLSFALSNKPESFIQNKEEHQHFRYVFLDTLLHYVNVLDIHKWKELSTLLTQYVTQYRLSREVLEQWQDYLKGLQLLDILQSSEGIENGVATPVAQPQPSSPVSANGTKRPSWFARLRHFHFKSDPSDYQKAKKDLEGALRSRKVDLIADVWTQYGAIIDTSHPEQIAQDKREQIAASLDLVLCCRDAAKSSTFSPELAKEIVRVNRSIEAYNLQPSSIQNEYINKARNLIDVQSTGYSNQSSTSSPSGPLAGQNSSVSARQTPQGPNPILLRSPSGPTKFDIDDDSKPGKRK